MKHGVSSWRHTPSGTVHFCRCGAQMICPAEAGARGGKTRTPAQVDAARTNLDRTIYRCSCGAKGRQISRWRVKGGYRTRCKKCGKSGMRADG